VDDAVWILDENEDSRTLTVEGLVKIGIAAMAFASPRALLSHARRIGPPRAAAIDAWTAEGSEREIRGAIPWKLTVLTTSPGEQVVRWMSLGVSRFLLKPFEFPSLIEHVSWAA
jgi:FixJ family two-component response regulator